MPSPRHDALNKLVQHHPDLPIRLLREIGGIDLPAAPLTVGPGDLPDRVSREMRADTVVFGGPQQDRWYSVIVEVETKMTEEKLRQVAVGAVSLWLETRKPVYVIFITPDPDAAKFTGPVEVDTGCLTVTMRPVIVGPGYIPILTTAGAMADDLLMTVLSVMAHGGRSEVAEAFAKLLSTLPPDDATFLYSYTIDMAPPRTRRLLEETVTVYISEHSSWLQGLCRKYRTEGRAEEAVASVLSVLRCRDIEVPPARERQISTCTDLAQLHLWLRRAAIATCIDDLFDDAPGAESRS